jgi:D-3-phosphoglycerate dehydrogenase / 2-oxoglutarate reductase
MKRKYTILVADHLNQAGWDVLQAAEDVVPAGPCETRQELLSAVAGAHALIVRSSTLIDEELLSHGPNLRVVARAGTQIQNIDIDLATRLGIMVVNVPDANVIAVVEHTWAMLLALARSLPIADSQVRHGNWPRHSMLGFQLFGKSIGLVGFGRLGREMAQRALAFGMKVLAYDPYIDLAFARAQGIEMVDFTELLARADIISLHTSHTPQTHFMINTNALNRVKPGAILVNCVNAGLVNEDALVSALQSGKLAGAAIDTFSQEPPAPDHPLFRLPNVVLAPHLNQNTVESQELTSRQVVENVLAALRGEDYRNIVNLPFYEGSPDRRPVLYRSVKPYLQLAAKMGKLQGQLAEGWITRLEVETLGEGLRDLVRPVTAVLLSGMLRAVKGRPVNWISAPVHAYDQGIAMSQAKELVRLADYPNLIACRIYWEGGHRTVAGALFANGSARLVQYEQFQVDAVPEGYVLILENDDAPGVIGKVGTRLGQAGININQWRYGREETGGQAVSFINLDARPAKSLLAELEKEPQIHRARLVYL